MILSIKQDMIDHSLSAFRLIRPEQIKRMEKSLDLDGQLQPVVVRGQDSLYQLIDGFKRYYASENLNWKVLQARVVEVDQIEAKAMILSYNRQGSGVADLEEAQVVHSLKTDHLLKQEEIADLLSRSNSWVSRRLSLIQRLDDCVRTHLQMGQISSTHARELAKLPRGKQNCFLKIIITHNLTSRQTAVLITKYLESKTQDQQAFVETHPMQVIEQGLRHEESSDCRLSVRANNLLKSARILARSQHIFIGQSTNPSIDELDKMEQEILSSSFKDIYKKSKTLQSILKHYSNHEG